MSRQGRKDYYKILGVKPTASLKEIHAAFRARAKRDHPDRVHREKDPELWKLANEIFAKLTEAYTVLRDPDSRREYDQSISADSSEAFGETSAHGEQEAPRPPPVEVGELTYGVARFEDLPESTRQQLLRRQSSDLPDQARVVMRSPVANYAWAAVLTGWFGVLFYNADGPHWAAPGYAFLGAASCIAGVFIGLNIATVSRFRRSKLAACFYVTPLYFIKTMFDVVTYRPIWTLEDASALHHYQNGGYQYTELTLTFKVPRKNDSPLLEKESLRFKSLAEYARFSGMMEAVRTVTRRAFESNDARYFRECDDFFGVERLQYADSRVLPRATRNTILALSILGALLLFAVSCGANAAWSRARWIELPLQSPAAQPWNQRPIAPAIPLPVPKPVPRHVQLPPAVPVPAHGTTKRFSSLEAIAPLKIVTGSVGHYYFIKLTKPSSREALLTVFVHGGQTVELDVPLGRYSMKYATGSTWYGERFLFGDETQYWKADEVFNFHTTGNYVNGYTVELILQENGNLKTEAVEPANW